MCASNNRYPEWKHGVRPTSDARYKTLVSAAVIFSLASTGETAPELRLSTPDEPIVATSSRLPATTVALSAIAATASATNADHDEPPDVVLLQVEDRTPAQVLSVEIDNTLVAMPGSKFSARKESATEWSVIVEPSNAIDDPSLNRLNDKPLGRLRTEGDSVLFSWAADAAQRPHCVSQFSNSIVAVEFPGGTRPVCPRQSAQWSAPKVDLSKSVVRARIPVSPLVALDLLSLEVTKIHTPKPHFYPLTDSKKESDELRVVMMREDPVRSTLDVRVVQKGDQLMLEMRAYYHDPGGARRPMVAKQMISSAKKRQDLLQSAHNTVDAARTAIPRLESNLQLAKSRTSDDPRENGVIIRNIQAADSALKKAIRARDRASRAIPEITSGLEDMKQAIDIAKALHGKAKVELRLTARTPDFEVPLLVCGYADESPRNAR